MRPRRKLFFLALCLLLFFVIHSDARTPAQDLEFNVAQFKKTRKCQEKNLAGADLTQASFIGASLYKCNLTGANLSNVHLRFTKINSCLLDNANLEGAVIEDSVLERCSMRGATPPKAIRNTLTSRTLWVNNCLCNDKDCSNCTAR